MDVRFSAPTKDGYIATLTCCKVPFWKWLMAVLHLGWSRPARRKFRELMAQCNRNEIPTGLVWTREEGMLKTPRPLP